MAGRTSPGKKTMRATMSEYGTKCNIGTSRQEMIIKIDRNETRTRLRLVTEVAVKYSRKLLVSSGFAAIYVYFTFDSSLIHLLPLLIYLGSAPGAQPTIFTTIAYVMSQVSRRSCANYPSALRPNPQFPERSRIVADTTRCNRETNAIRLLSTFQSRSPTSSVCPYRFPRAR
jgi:hypothetical protein